MNELLIDMKNKYPTFDITPQHLGQIVRDNRWTILEPVACVPSVKDVVV